MVNTTQMSAAPAGRLRWRIVDAYHAESECLRYTVTKITTGDGVQYEAWHRSGQINERGRPREAEAIAWHLKSSTEAREAAEAHAQQRSKSQEHAA